MPQMCCSACGKSVSYLEGIRGILPCPHCGERLADFDATRPEVVPQAQSFPETKIAALAPVDLPKPLGGPLRSIRHAELSDALVHYFEHVIELRGASATLEHAVSFLEGQPDKALVKIFRVKPEYLYLELQKIQNVVSKYPAETPLGSLLWQDFQAQTHSWPAAVGVFISYPEGEDYRSQFFCTAEQLVRTLFACKHRGKKDIRIAWGETSDLVIDQLEAMLRQLGVAYTVPSGKRSLDAYFLRIKELGLSGALTAAVDVSISFAEGDKRCKQSFTAAQELVRTLFDWKRQHKEDIRLTWGDTADVVINQVEVIARQLDVAYTVPRCTRSLDGYFHSCSLKKLRQRAP